MKILVVEDDAKTARALAQGLRGEGFEATIAKTGEEGFFLMSSENFDVVVLDWMLPGRDGIEVLKTLRARGTKTPVLLLTARDAVEGSMPARMIISSSRSPLQSCSRGSGRCSAGRIRKRRCAAKSAISRSTCKPGAWRVADRSWR